MSVETFLSLFGVATAVALGARWLRVPYTVALVLTGLALGSTGYFHPPALTHALLFSLILPGLIFEAAFHLEARSVWKDRWAINGMATPGLLLGMAITAALLVPLANALSLVTGFTLVHGLVFASIVGATDPIAIVALFKTIRAPARLRVIVEGESLLNDGTGVVIFTLAVAMVEGPSFTLVHGAIEFVRVAGLGAAVGLGVGLGLGLVLQRVDDAMIEVTVTVLAAYGSFLIAEHLGVSGVISTVAAGLWIGNRAGPSSMSLATRGAVTTFWEFLAFAFNSTVFLLIGFQVRLASLLSEWKPILAAYLVTTIARAAMVYLTTFLLRRTSARLPWSWALALSWSGLRGALSMVLVLSLPPAFPHRELLVHMTFGIVLLTILIQGLTMGPLIRWLGLVGAEGSPTSPGSTP